MGNREHDQGRDSREQQVRTAGRERNTIGQTESGQADQSHSKHKAGQTESQNAYWREQYRHEPYYRPDTTFERYESAYRTGIEGNALYRGHRFEEVEGDLRSNYETRPGARVLGWEQGANVACRAAWDRAERMQSGDRDTQSER